MASLAAKAARNREARNRLEASLQTISKRLDIPIPPESRRMRDPELQPIAEVERFVTFAESVEEALAARAREGEAPGGYETWTVAMLRDEIARRELNTGGAKNKAELIFVLEEDDTAPDVVESEPESSGLGSVVFNVLGSGPNR